MKCRKILVIEPDESLRLPLQTELRRREYDVHFALNAHEALARLQEDPLPDVILLELDLPEMNGWEFLGVQKSTPRIADIPTLVYSEGAEMARRFPAGRYIEKRPDFSDLLESLDRLCEDEKPVIAPESADQWPEENRLFPASLRLGLKALRKKQSG